MSARWLAPLVVGLALLAGCSKPTPANDTLPPLSAPTTEATPTLAPLGPTDFPMPQEARQQTPEGADAFLDYFIGLLNHEQAQPVPSGQPVRDLAQDDCRDCARIANNLDAVAAAGQRYSGGTLTLGVRGAFTLDGATASAAFRITQDPSDLISADGSVVEGQSAPAYPDLSSGISLTWSSVLSTWTVTSLTFG